MTDLAKLVVRLEAQSAQMIAELDKANRKIDRFASATNKTLSKWAGNLIGIFSARALVQFGADVLKAQDQLNDLSQRSGESVENVSRLGYAAEQSGSSVDGLAISLKNLSKTSSAAAKGNKEAVASFDAIGVEVEKTDGTLKNSRELLLDIADQFSRYEDGLQKSAAAQKIFGKSGEELIPFLNKGRAGIEALERKADELGITMSTKAAQAADDFGDNMATLAAITRGVVGKALEEVVPIINRITEGMINSAEGTERFDKTARVLAAGMKILISTGLVVGEIFDRVGEGIGANLAALSAIAQGNLKEAYSIVKEFGKDTASSVAETAAEIAKVWDDTGAVIVDDLSEVSVTVKKVFGTEIAESVETLRKKLEDAGKALTEKLLTPFERMQADIKTADELLKANVITFETWQRAVIAAADAFDPFLGAIARANGEVRDLGAGLREQLISEDAGLSDEIEKWAKEENDRWDKMRAEQKKKQDVFLDQAARNTQDILADGLEQALHDGIDAGAKGALDAFGKMLERMALQAIAANIAGKIFGTGEPGSGGGWLDAAISWGSKLFGGGVGPGGIPTRDSGGRGYPGVPVAIGVGAQPEVFVPDSMGEFYPRGQWGRGGGAVTQNIYTQGPITARSARQLELEAAQRQRVATARLG